MMLKPWFQKVFDEQSFFCGEFHGMSNLEGTTN